MVDLVPSDEIERIVGADRHPDYHLGRAVSKERAVYVLHSEKCLRGYGSQCPADLRDCLWSQALGRGILEDDWSGSEDQVVVLGFCSDSLVLLPLDDTVSIRPESP